MIADNDVDDRLLRRLDWDSAHFGIPVCQVVSAGLDDRDLEVALRAARRDGMALIYWFTTAERVVPPSLLAAYAGKLVDWKTTYAAAVEELEQGPAVVGETRVIELPRGAASDDLVQLGIAAGVYSRFRMDPRVAAEATDRLYAVWTERCARGELADVVLVASAPECEGWRGMVTVRRAVDTGSIGLIAVHPRARGQGLGAMLLRAAHGWMAARGLRQARVVTQRANDAACRLYRRSGYHVADVQQVYHFWPLEQNQRFVASAAP